MRARPRVGEILVSAGIIDEMQLEAALSEQSRWGRRLGVTLIKLGMVEEGHLIRALAKQLNLPVASLAGKRIPPDVIGLVPARVAIEHAVIPLFKKQEGPSGQLFLGMEDPSNLDVLDDLSFRTGMEIHPVMVGPTELGQAIDRYYHDRDSRPPETDPFRNGETMGPVSLRVVTDDSAQPGTAPATAPSSARIATLTDPMPPLPDSRDTVFDANGPQPASLPPLPPLGPSSASPAFSGRVTEGVAERAQVADPSATVAPGDAATHHAVPVATASSAIPDALLEDVARAIDESERTRVVAKAIVQLLIEKGIVSLAEVQEKTAQLKAASPARPVEGA